MKTLDRHLLREFMTPVMYCLVTFTMVFVIYDLFDRMDRFIQAETSVRLITTYYLFLIGPTLEYLAPASLMLAALYTLYVLSRNSELVAMRACGVSIYRVITPFIMVGLFFSIALLLASETVIPYANEWSMTFRENRYRPFDQRLYEDAQYYNAAEGRLWSIGSFNPRQPEVLHGVEVMVERPDGRWRHRITAERAEWRDRQWWFSNAQIQRYGDHNNPIGGPEPYGYGRPRVVHIAAFSEPPSVFASSTREWEFLSTSEMMTYVRSHPHLSSADMASKRYDIAARLAMPWACLIVILFAIPAGARTGRQGALAAVFSAIGMLVAFYTLSQVGLILGRSQVVSPWLGAWLSNIVFLGLGIGMICKLR